MSYVSRTLAVAVCTVLTMGVVSATAQVTAAKDAWLVMKVHSEFVNEDALAGSNIDVDVKDGVVTLQGTVPSEVARAKAIAEARDNDGVKNVIDQLRIAPKTGTARRTTPTTGDKVDKAADKSQSAAKSTGRAIDDGWIKSKIYAQYMADWNTVLDDSDIDIDVKDNVVTLSGTVKSAEAKAKAVATAKATDGVKSVKDNLRVSTSSR